MARVNQKKSVVNVEEARNNLNRLARPFLNSGSIMAKVGRDEVGLIRSRLAAGIDVNQKLFTPLQYLVLPRVSPNPLMKTGALYRGFFSIANDKELRIGNTTNYWLYHNQGTSKIPQRQMVDSSQVAGKVSQALFDTILDNRGLPF